MVAMEQRRNQRYPPILLRGIWRRLLVSPAQPNEYLSLELSGAWEPPDSSDTSSAGEGQATPFVFLIETKCMQAKASSLKIKLGNDSVFAVDCKGLSGGLILLWKSTVKLEIQNFSRRQINAIIHPDGANGSPWKFTGFYGHPDAAKRLEGWSLLHHLSTLEPIPWLCVGDYNEILTTSEMSGIHYRARSQMELFQKALEHCRLQELGFQGLKFTWSNGRQGTDHTMERLDRALANMEWCELFDVVEVSILARICSDHNLIHVAYSTSSAIKWNKMRQFRF
jgi:hypothetical protein